MHIHDIQMNLLFNSIQKVLSSQRNQCLYIRVGYYILRVPKIIHKELVFRIGLPTGHTLQSRQALYSTSLLTGTSVLVCLVLDVTGNRSAEFVCE